MGMHENIDKDKFPKQGEFLNKRVKVCFRFDADNCIRGVIIRDDIEDPFRTIIKLDDGRVVLAIECQYSVIQ